MSKLFHGKNRIHFIGIAGIGMSGLAKVLQASGFSVSGSDVKEGKMIRDLKSRGVIIHLGHHASNAHGADLVVYSSAIRPDNPELVYAKEKGIALAHRAQVLAEFMNNQENSVAVLGTHGKTTTSSFVSHILTSLDFHPTCFVGGEMMNFGDNVLLGESHWTVAEVDESDGTHLYFSPSHVIVTNIEEDHLDHYSDLEDIKNNFRKFLMNLKPDSTVIYSADCPNLRDIMKDVPHRKIAYGFSPEAEFSASDVRFSGLSTFYRLIRRHGPVAEVSLGIPGIHNVMNSLAVIALLASVGIPTERFLRYIPEFRGAARRLQVKWEGPGPLVFDDYAHHPTEVQASLEALKSFGRNVTCIFQPHRYSRAESFAQAFGAAFGSADRLILTEIYGAGETNVHGIDSGIIQDAVTRHGHRNILRIPKEMVIDYLWSNPIPNEIVAFLGAGDITEVADRYVDSIKSHDPGLEKVG